MYLPKKDVYESLKKLGYYVSQTQPPVFTKLPAIIFNVGNNTVNTDLDNNISSQNLEIIVDVWAEDSVSASKVTSEVENIMRQNLYRMSFSNDVPNVGNLFHIANRFTKII